MDKYSEIKQKIRRISGGSSPVGDRLPVFVVKIKSVDGAACTVEYDGADFSDVRLRSVINDSYSKIVVTPKEDSYVLVVDISGNLTELAVLQYSEIEKIEINCENVVFNGGKNFGLVKIDKLTERLKNLETKFNNHTHQVSGTGLAAGNVSVTGMATASAITGKSNEFQGGYSAFENVKIKH